MLSNKPFLTADFSQRGGGIDFLGLRWVGLTIVGQYLVPELNNVTRDMGTMFVGTWIPWKFRKLCAGSAQYTEKNYRGFREKVEVGLSLTLRGESGLERDCGELRNKIGNTQKCPLPATLSFKNAKRKTANSLFAAAIYGPALQALGLIRSYRTQAQPGQPSLEIPVVSDEADTNTIAEGVERSLSAAGSFRLLGSLDAPSFEWPDIKSLGERGLDPSIFRRSEFDELKASFRRCLLPADKNDPGYGRTLTTRLLLQTLDAVGEMSPQDIREIWYTGLTEDGSPLELAGPDIQEHQQRWSCFMARQHQRYAIEIFLWAFETGLKEGLHSIEEIVAYWFDRTSKGGEGPLVDTFDEALRNYAHTLLKDDDLATSQAWNKEITSWHEYFEDTDDPKGDLAVGFALDLLAGWYWRMLARQGDPKTKALMNLGGSDRMSMSWFMGWLEARRMLPIKDFLRDVFSDLIFSQHMRVAVARFDGSSQRLRFLLGDRGIEPTTSALKDLGELLLPWMPDRLDTLISLLCDCDVLAMENETLVPGPASSELPG